ncbi:MAG: DNA repair protein RecN [Ignavibacteriales bacterium]|nr:DNA repair protein RecN [Ignavibacteriales bacterium]
MLKSLQIQDYALIEKINVDFGAGLNIITGETGAGKSILIDAMSLLLGERATTEVIRKYASKTVVEGIFDVTGNDNVKKLIEENDLEVQPELIMRREISLKGSNRCFINDTPVSLSLIKDVGNFLVDLHGQHEHQSLLRSETHIETLDDFGNYKDDLIEYNSRRQNLLSLLNDLKILKAKEAILSEKKEFYAYQIKEIDSVSPVEGEEEKLVEELKILENAERLLQSTNEIYQNIYDKDNAVYNSLVKIKNELIELAKIDKSFSDSRDECESVLTQIKDIAEFVRTYKEKIDLEPERLEEVRDRLGAISLLKKKYGGSLKSVIEHRYKIGEEFNLAENFAQRISELDNEIIEVQNECGKVAGRLSKKRLETSQIIKSEAIKALSFLGISDAQFEVKIEQQSAEPSDNFILFNNKKYKFNNRGIDEVEFYISTNKGEDPKPLVKVASGGEVSRIMLALKSILAKNEQLPLLIFDEIDTGVSGRVAQKVGLNLKSLASFHQIIAITHLPQIAGLADHHYGVEKIQNEERVTSSIRKLSKEERVREVAKLLSGEEITTASLKSAKELMGI